MPDAGRMADHPLLPPIRLERGKFSSSSDRLGKGGTAKIAWIIIV